MRKLREQVGSNKNDSAKKIVVNIGNSKRVSQIAAQLQKKFFQFPKIISIIISCIIDLTPVINNNVNFISINKLGKIFKAKIRTFFLKNSVLF